MFSAGGVQMILYPRSQSHSGDDDEALARLCDPELARRLRKANPKFFTHGRTSIAKILALAGIVSLVSGYFIEPVVLAPYRDHEAMMTTQVRHVPPPVPPAPVRHHHAPATHAKPVIAVRDQVIVVQPEPMPQVQPKKHAQRRTRALTVAQPETNTNAQNEEAFWLKAQAEARAKDRMRAKAQAVTAAAVKASEDAAVQAPPKASLPTSDAPQITIAQPPVDAPRVPGPVSGPWPTLPGGGPCTPGRGPILIGGHGLGGMIINSVLQSIPIHHGGPPGRP